MCRSDINPAARGIVGRLLADMAAALRRTSGLPADVPVVIGPVDFGEPEIPDPDDLLPSCAVPDCPWDPLPDGRCLPHQQPTGHREPVNAGGGGCG